MNVALLLDVIAVLLIGYGTFLVGVLAWLVWRFFK
jgi:Flp pilus assembly pilin Flp